MSTVVSSEVMEPYAQALMSIAQSSDLVDQFGENVEFLLGLLESSDDLRQFLANPLLKPDVKKDVLRQLAGEQVHPYMLNFLMLLVDRKRIAFLAGVCQQYRALLRRLRKTALAEVVSAVALTDEQKEAVRQKVIQMVGAQQVELDARIDPDLIGGVVIKVGSQIVDASLRGQIRRIGLKLANAT
jgi:F-type H+-transporting ATPase subunit delta